MVLKTDDTKSYNITMILTIDWIDEEIDIDVEHEDKAKKTLTGFRYSADEFSKAIAKFKELEEQYYKKYKE